MIRLKSLISILSLIVLASFTAKASELIVVTIDVNKAAEEYYKVQEFIAELKASEDQAKEKITAFQEEGQSLVKEFEDLVEQAKSDILTEDARKEAQQDAIKMRQQIESKQGEIQQFVQNTQRSFAQREQTQMMVFYKEIQAVIDEIAKERSASLVLDLAGATRNGLPTVLYSDASLDITSEVVTRINADKPAE